MVDHQFVRLYTGASIIDAGLLQDLLEQHGIPTQMRNYHTSSAIGELPFVETHPEIFVPQAHLNQAKRLLAELNEDRSGDPDWICQGCQEINPGSFDLCWQCGQTNQAVLG